MASSLSIAMQTLAFATLIIGMFAWMDLHAMTIADSHARTMLKEHKGQFPDPEPQRIFNHEQISREYSWTMLVAILNVIHALWLWEMRNSLLFAKLSMLTSLPVVALRVVQPFLDGSTRGVIDPINMDSRIFHISIVNTIIDVLRVGHLAVLLWERGVLNLRLPKMRPLDMPRLLLGAAYVVMGLLVVLRPSMADSVLRMPPSKHPSFLLADELAGEHFVGDLTLSRHFKDTLLRSGYGSMWYTGTMLLQHGLMLITMSGYAIYGGWKASITSSIVFLLCCAFGVIRGVLVDPMAVALPDLIALVGFIVYPIPELEEAAERDALRKKQEEKEAAGEDDTDGEDTGDKDGKVRKRKTQKQKGKDAPTQAEKPATSKKRD